MTEEDSPLTAEQRRALQDGQARLTSFMGAAKVAAINGWTLGGFAALSILSGLFSPVGFVIGVGLAVVARNEFTGRAKLRRLDPAGLDLLWRNQLGLMALIVGYCGWSMLQTGRTIEAVSE